MKLPQKGQAWGKVLESVYSKVKHGLEKFEFGQVILWTMRYGVRMVCH